MNNLESYNPEESLNDMLKDYQSELNSLQSTIDIDGGPDKDPEEGKKEGEKKDPKVEAVHNFTDIETAVTHEGNARIRAITSSQLNFKLTEKQKLELGYFGLNEFEKDLGSYFGRHVPNIGISGIPNFKAIGVIKTTAEGVIDAKYGLRYLVSDPKGRIFGWADVTGNKKGANVTFFLGTNIGKKGTSVGVSSGTEIGGGVSQFTEIQVDQKIAKGFNVFMRGEVPGVQFNNGKYLLGVTKKF